MGPGERGLKRLIVTADDFGLSLPVNEAVEHAHTDGILTTTCLMVSGPAAQDAVARARRLPDLAVGLHIVTVCGRSTLPTSEVPDLVDDDGCFDSNLVRAGFRYFFLPRVRRQLAKEIRAQFEVFAETGLPLDHVNAHNHMHVHPTVLELILSIGRDYGLSAVRVPYEPANDGNARTFGEWFVGLWINRMKRTVQRAGLRFNDFVVGLRDTGRMDRNRLIPMLSTLPDGVSEVFCHPATGKWEGMDPAAHDYSFEEEYKALLDADIRKLASKSGIQLISFQDI